MSALTVADIVHSLAPLRASYKREAQHRDTFHRLWTNDYCRTPEDCDTCTEFDDEQSRVNAERYEEAE